MTVSTADRPSTASASRIVGIDVARGVAVLGMFVAHLVPDHWPETLADGRSSVLFATLAGVSLGLITGGATPTPSDSRGPARSSVALRALFLVGLGLLLWTLDSGIAIILDYYGAFYLVLIAVLFAPRAVLAAIAAALAGLAGFVLSHAPDTAAGLIGSDPVLYLPTEWFVTGYYPGVLWVVYLLIGLIAARSDLTRARTQVTLVASGVAGVIVGYGGAALLGTDASAHSDTVWEMLGAGGLAAALIGTLTAATAPSARFEALARAARGVTWPVAAVGSMPLTVYTSQILVLTAFRSSWGDSGSDAERLALLAGMSAGSLVLASLWRRFIGRGPLEWLVARISRR